ncbi:TPA: hypothetical protein I8Z14_001415 [Legionella pneumophila]|nr:hypothetical protein [Legionella pneumophila]HAU1758232.1 hypothetical protein [Legionella pneumophila]HEN4749889.1 hypothetical protein [Legionella pneumophila]
MKFSEKLIETDKRHSVFNHLISNNKYSYAISLIELIIEKYSNDILKNQTDKFIKEFQGQGFNGCLFEIYLYQVLLDLQNDVSCNITRVEDRPDFKIIFNKNQNIFIEATSLNPTQRGESKKNNIINFGDLLLEKSHNALLNKIEKYFPKKYLLSINKKLSDKLDTISYVQGHPLIIGLHDYHEEGSLFYSRHALERVLYGIGLTENIEPIFKRKDAEGISAILFSIEATTMKFVRMAKVLGIDKTNNNIIRFGQAILLEDNKNLKYKSFKINLDNPYYREDWHEGIFLYHNPNATIPLEPKHFPRFTHVYHKRETNKLKHLTRPMQICWSCTYIQESHLCK